jgi:hypothetical protein
MRHHLLPLPGGIRAAASTWSSRINASITISVGLNIELAEFFAEALLRAYSNSREIPCAIHLG